MIRKAATALASLGLIGGAGSVVYNQHGDATVKIKDKNGRVQSVQISGAGGKTFSCPTGTHDKVASIDVGLGRIKLTLQGVRHAEQTIERRYPARTAPGAVVDRYNALSRREHRLVVAYNVKVDSHNAIIDKLCSPE